MDSLLLTVLNQILIHPLLDIVMVGLTVGGLGLLPGLGLVLLFGRERRVGLAVLVALAVGLALTLIFQQLALRPRPEAVRLLLPTPNFPSYPSGHAAVAFSTALVVGLSYRQVRWWGLALMGASLIGLSRVYLGHHYPSDILGGALLGASVGAACYGLIVVRAGWADRSGHTRHTAAVEPEQAGRSTRSRLTGWPWLLWLQIAVALIVTQMAYLDLLPGRLLQWPLADKALHFLLIGSIAFWLNLWLRGRRLPLGVGSVPLALLIPFTIALLEEGAQFYSPVRSADPTDLLSDVLGLLFFWWLSERLVAPSDG